MRKSSVYPSLPASTIPFVFPPPGQLSLYMAALPRTSHPIKTATSLDNQVAAREATPKPAATTATFLIGPWRAGMYQGKLRIQLETPSVDAYELRSGWMNSESLSCTR